MIISTSNPAVAVLLADVCLRIPDGSGWSTATANATQLDNLTTVLWRKHRGEWRVASDNPGSPIPEAELNQLEDATWNAFILAPAFINADSDDLTVFLEEVYRHPVTLTTISGLPNCFVSGTQPLRRMNTASHRGATFRWRDRGSTGDIQRHPAGTVTQRSE